MEESINSLLLYGNVWLGSTKKGINRQNQGTKSAQVPWFYQPVLRRSKN
jgi:hypothetical protein